MIAYLSKRGAILALLLVAVFGPISGVATVSSTEVITVPNVNTGEPMQLEVEREVGEAKAAGAAFLDCGRRVTRLAQARVNGVWRTMTCGRSVGTGGNSVSYVRDGGGPICVYYGNTLAGCAGIGNLAYVGNRPYQQAVVRTQTNRT